MKDLIQKNISGKKVLLFFILANLVYAAMLIITIPEVMHYSGGMKILDMMPTGYDTYYVNTLLNTLGKSGRDSYLNHQLPLDLIYPALFGISSCLVLAYFLNKLKKLDSLLFYLCLIPLISGFFDYGENIGIISMLRDYPNISVLQVQITSTFSILKSILTSIYFIILIITLLAVAKNNFFPKKG
ncbi:hypothetical protein [Flavobacterium laiguense]|uniref:Uncharacterized protein n=1 Tax=Flavobacterium laiguense TaxID=2169409 RepID=A0A2U1JW36_9FLAO|nr:hypothetical protein [Flavobacterium laiguense]PWA09417.1 hypothetical protein DB891_08850 [Flavobacterium laiguense]